MENQKLGQEPAFPVTNETIVECSGISKRFYAACAAMKGLLANSHIDVIHVLHTHRDKAISDCYDFADELLRQEEH